MAVAVSDEVEAKDLIAKTNQLNEFSKQERYCDDVNNDGVPDPETGVCTWDDLNLTMTLTGPVPITNAVTEFSFKLFWEIFPTYCSSRTWFVRFPLRFIANRNYWHKTHSGH